MTIKIEITKLPNNNTNQVSSWDETTLNGQTKKQNQRKFIVPEENTDEFVKKHKNTTKTSTIITCISALAGFITCAVFMKKQTKYDMTALGILSGISALVCGTIPMLVHKIRENALFKKLNVQEIKQ